MRLVATMLAVYVYGIETELLNNLISLFHRGNSLSFAFQVVGRIKLINPDHQDRPKFLCSLRRCL